MLLKNTGNKKNELNSTGIKPMADQVVASKESTTELTSTDYYFDSYAHFGIHEVFVFI
jgi:hypothetical protein